MNRMDRSNSMNKYRVLFAPLSLIFIFLVFSISSSAVIGDCVLCHDISNTTTNSTVNVSAMNQSWSNHGSLNNGTGTSLNSDNERCWACHAMGIESTSDNHTNWNNSAYIYDCLDCHNRTKNLSHTNAMRILNLSASDLYEHIPTGDTIGTYSIQNCTDCHTNSLNYSSQNESVRGNVSHYGTTSQLLSPTTDCRLCHTNSTNAINYNVTSSNLRHPAQSSDPEFCVNCHGNTSTNLHDSNLSYGMGDIHMSFDWENDGVEDTFGMQQAMEGCFVCHNQGVTDLMGLTNDSNTKICEECHTNVSFTGPFNNSKLNITTSSINDSIPRVLIHTNLSSVITVANQSFAVGSSSNLSTPSSCYSYNTTTGNGSCHGVRSDKNISAGGYFAFYNNTAAGRMDAYRFTGIIDRLPNTSDCRLCHLGVSPNGTLVNSSWWAYPVNVSSSRPTAALAHTNASAVASDCWVCHAVSASKPKDFHSSNVSRGGGPDCISCHGISGTALHLVNETAMNSSGAVHANLNSNATNSTDVSVENKKCWGCHQSDGAEPVGMGDRYLTPYECYDCHNITKPYANVSTALIVSEHFTSGDNITAGYAANNTYSCLSCHNKSELQVSAAEPDIYNSTLSKASHYAKNMSFLRTGTNTSVFCGYCHQNTSTVFVSAMNDTGNANVLNHTDATTNPTCTNSTCHSEGWMHNSTLTKPTNLDYTLCTQCHTAKTNHAGTLDCTACHTNSTTKIHPIQYLTTSNTIVPYDSSSAVNCTTCHQQSTVDGSLPIAPPKIPVTMNHSDDSYAGGKWNVSGQSFWSNTSTITSCYFCHTNDTHNVTSLGNVGTITYNETLNGSITTNSTWCAGCHYDGDSDYSNMSAAFGANRPPSITNASHPNGSDGTVYYNHSLSNYSDYWCAQCHNLFSMTTTAQFVHNLSIGVSGGRDCVACHDIAGLSPKIDVSAANDSTAIHKNLNNNSTGLTLNVNNQRCWACHGDGNGSQASQPASGHPVNYTSPKVCEDCHNPMIQFAAPQVFEHFASANELNVSAACSTCHNESEMKLANNDPNPLSSTANSSASHYGKTRSDIVTGGAVDCEYCHNATSVFPVLAGHDNVSKHNTPNPVSCANSTCHDSGRMHDQNLTKPVLAFPNSTYCQTCHIPKSQHNSSVDCSRCHINTTFDIHTIKFIQDGGGFATNNTSAATCTSCHQSTIAGFAAPNAGILNHSSDPDSGSKWNATGYWSNQSTSCIFCHNNSLHTADALGNLAPLRGAATNFSGIVCGSCHKSDNVYYSNIIANLTLLPPEILTNITSTDGTVFINHTGLANYTDASCKLCHENLSNVPVNVTEMSHDTAAGNFSNCISCHSSGFLGAPVVNSTSLSNSIHGNLSNASSNLNYACWTCHYNGTTPPIHPTNLSNAKACEVCHTRSSPLFLAPVVVEHRPVADDIFTNASDGCLICHNNSVDVLAVYNNSADRISHAGTTTYLMTSSNNSTECTWCHFDNPSNVSWGTPVDPNVTVASLNHSQFANSTQCYLCHVVGGNTPSNFHNASLSPGGGPDCISCHGISGIALHLVNETAMNSSGAVHANLNSNATNSINVSAENKKCWGCHQSDGSEPTDMGDRYVTPYGCYDCHNSTKPYVNVSTAPIVYEHFTSGDNITAGYAANSTYSCLSCHNKTELQVNAIEPDIYNSTISMASHYAKNMSFLRNGTNGSVSCGYCHQNTSTVFVSAMNDTANANVLNHTDAATSPTCTNSTCHSEGGMHNSTLTKPTNLNATLCTQCHTTKSKHAGTLDCTACHANSTEKIHPIQYLTITNTTVPYDSSSAVNCTTCHQQSTVDGSIPIAPPKVAVILNHSEDPYAGGKWNVSGQSFWSNTSTVTSCNFCHTSSTHSVSPLGNISTIAYGEIRNGSLSTDSTWCAGCHYDGDSDYANMSAAFGSNRPPSITNSSHPNGSDGTVYFNHSFSNYSDYWCAQCHNLFSTNKTVQFVHNLSVGVSGGRDCVACHDITGISPKIDVSAANDSIAIHKNLNNNSTGRTLNFNNQRCWACHGDGNGSEASQPTSGHPVNYTSPKVCEDCHTPTIQFAAPQVFEHFASANELNVSTACSTCHNESEMKLANSDPNPLSSTANSSASHYGKTRSDIVTGGVVDCDYCHQNTSSVFPLIGDHNNVGNHSTSTSVSCANSTCHNGSRMHGLNLTKPSLALPNSTYCQTCHSTKSQHNSSVDCSLCHINTTFDIHTIKFIQDGGGFATNNTSAATCISCHQSNITGFAAPNAGILNHSSDPDSGSKWNATGYWSNQSTSCIFCHNNTLHTADALGNLAPLRGVATNFSGIVCGSCHRNNNSYYASITANLTLRPPEILTNITSTDGTVFINHTGLANYTDASCKLCHENLSNVPVNVTEMAHDTAAGNFSNCISCHSSGFLGAPVVNTTSLNNSIHGNLNNANTSLNYACWACHYDGTTPPIHPTNLSDAKACEDCHTKSSPLFSAPVVVEHRPNANDILTNTTESCLFCHNNSVDPLVTYSNNASRISHSGTTTYLMTPSNNSTQCMWCHFDNPTNGSWGTPVDPQVTVPSLNHSQFTNSTECYTCHVAGGGTPPHFHDETISPGAGKDCVSCHNIGGAAPSIRQLDISSMNRTSSIHYGLNSNSNGLTLNPANQRCWACHGDGDGSEAAQPVGHPVNYKTPKDCSSNECHSINQSIFMEPMIYSHFNDSDLVDNSADHVTENVSTNSRCQYCHDEALEHYTENAESPLLAVVSHYGSNNGLVDLTDESCTYCHRDDDIDDREYAEDWGNATDPMDNVSALTDIRKMQKVTIEQGDSYNLGNGYYFTVSEIDLKGRQALLTLNRYDDVLARPVTDADAGIDEQYLYYEWWVDDGDEFNQTLVSLDTLDVFRGDDRDVNNKNYKNNGDNENRVLAQFEARGIKRLHNNQDVGVCWICHTKNPTVKQDEYIVLEKENDRTYYAPIYADFNDEDSPIQSLFIEEGSGWEAGDYRFAVDELDIKGQKARISLYYKDNLVKDDVVDTGDIFEYYRDDIVYENYDFENTTFFTVAVTDVFRSEERILATFDSIKAISLDITGISGDDDDVSGNGNDHEKGYGHEWFGGYNLSWLRINDTFKVGGRPDKVHSPMFIDGVDGGADCVMCHDTTMNFEIDNLSSIDAIRKQLGAHAGMNFAAQNDSVLTDEVDKSCWACHGEGTEPTRHPINYMSPRPCQSCHTWREEPTYGAVDLSDVDHGKQEHCTICHAASGDIHTIFPRRVFADIEGLTLTPSSLFERKDIQVNATAVSGWGMKVEQVEYFLDIVTEDGTGIPMIPVDGAIDSGQEDVIASINTSDLDFGIHTVHVHASERGGRWGYMRNETFIILAPDIIEPVIWPYVIAAFLLAIILWTKRFRVKAVRISNRTPVIGESIEIKASAYVGLNGKKSIESIMYRLDSSDAVGIEMHIADVSGRRSMKASNVLDTLRLRPGHHVVFVNAKRSDGKWCSLKSVRFDLLRSSDE